MNSSDELPMSTHKLPAAPDGGQHFFGAKFHTIAKIKIK
jgi:hypothetical protein